MKVGSSTPGLPIILKPTAEPAAAEGEDGVGTAKGPEHAGLLESATDHGFTPVTRLNAYRM